MSVGRILWAVLSAGLAFGINLEQKPVFTRAYERSEYETRTGELTLRAGAAGTNPNAEIPLATVHIVTADLPHVGKHYQIREVSLRAADDVLSTPRFEVFAALPHVGDVDLAVGAHNPAVLRGHDLPIEASGWLGSKPSYFIVSGDRPSPFISGSVRFDQLEPVDERRSAYQARGVLNGQVDTPDGPATVSAKINARVVWDAD